MIEKTRVYELCPNHRASFEALLRNGFYVPSEKDSILTLEFMNGVAQQSKYWLPMASEIGIYNCASAPSRQECAAELYEVLEACMDQKKVPEAVVVRMRATTRKVLKKPPSKQWSLNVLGSSCKQLGYEHPWFAKGFVRSKKVEPAEAALESKYVANVNGFFDRLP